MRIKSKSFVYCSVFAIIIFALFVSFYGARFFDRQVSVIDVHVPYAYNPRSTASEPFSLIPSEVFVRLASYKSFSDKVFPGESSRVYLPRDFGGAEKMVIKAVKGSGSVLIIFPDFQDSEKETVLLAASYINDMLREVVADAENSGLLIIKNGSTNVSIGFKKASFWKYYVGIFFVIIFTGSVALYLSNRFLKRHLLRA